MLSHVLGILPQETTLQIELDDSVTRKKAGGRRRTEAFAHTGAFYTENSLQKGAFYTQKVLRREVLLQGAFAHKRLGALHTEVFTRRSLYAEGFLHADAFAHRSFYTEKPLDRGAFTHKSVYTQQAFTYTGAFTQRSLYTEGFTQRSLYSKELLHTNVLELLNAKSVTQRSLYIEGFNAQMRLHTETFTQRSLYTESFYTRKLLHREVFTQTRFHTQKEAFTQTSLYTEKLLHTKTFTHKSFYTEESLHRGAFTRSNKLKLAAVLTEKPFAGAFGNSLAPQKPSISNKYAPNNLRNIFLKQVLVQFLSERCFRMFLAFFHKKQRWRLKMDNSVARKKAGGRRREDSTRPGVRQLHTSGLPYERPRATRALWWGAPQAADPPGTPTPGPEKHQKSFTLLGISFLAGIRGRS